MKKAGASVVRMVLVFVAPIVWGQLEGKPGDVNSPKVTSTFQARDVTIGKLAKLVDNSTAANGAATETAETVQPGERQLLAEGWQWAIEISK